MAEYNGGVVAIRGTEVHVIEEASNQSICVRYIFHNKIKNMMTNWNPWTFSLDRIVVDPEHRYSVSVYNLPKPDLGNYRLDKIITIPDPGNQLLTTPRSELEGVQAQEKRRKVFIVYSLDHPLYIEIILKLCAFLMVKCGTEWLDWQREQIVKSSDKILILCSRGVRAKWRAMCDGAKTQVTLREDVRSPMGDMLTPALSLLVPSFVRSGTFQNYMVAYFEDVCSEEDVPSPFNITVRYKLMKHFEELLFRLLDKEKHEPGRVNRIEGITEDEYFHCPSGKALRGAVEAFHAYQLEHPNWFEDELVKDTDADVEEEEPTLEHHAIGQPTESPITIRQSVPSSPSDSVCQSAKKMDLPLSSMM
ncbi:unnamed protein product [Coregonus sp. 'balchen']|nr:unnamed protein product [Coregonus sp. 'balchen']